MHFSNSKKKSRARAPNLRRRPLRRRLTPCTSSNRATRRTQTQRTRERPPPPTPTPRMPSTTTSRRMTSRRCSTGRGRAWRPARDRRSEAPSEWEAASDSDFGAPSQKCRPSKSRQENLSCVARSWFDELFCRRSPRVNPVAAAATRATTTGRPRPAIAATTSVGSTSDGGRSDTSGTETGEEGEAGEEGSW